MYVTSHQSQLACHAAVSCRCRLSWLAQTRNKNGRQHRGGTAHKGAETNVVIKFLSVLEDHVWFEDRWVVASLCDE
jgi:hypothetical protein